MRVQSNGEFRAGKASDAHQSEGRKILSKEKRERKDNNNCDALAC